MQDRVRDLSKRFYGVVNGDKGHNNQGLKVRELGIVLEEMTLTVEGGAPVISIEVVSRFYNSTATPIECTLACGLGSLCVVGLEVDGVGGHIHQKADALDAYDDAISRGGFTAVLGECDEQDVFAVRIGSLAPGKCITTKLILLGSLETNDFQRYFVLPATFFPYQVEPYRLIVRCAFLDQSFPLQVSIGSEDYILGEGEACNFSKTVEVSEPGTLLLRFHPQATHASMVLEREKTRDLVTACVTLCPSWEHLDNDLLEHRVEVLFLTDCSGSMSGMKITCVESALRLFVQSLPPGCAFNILRFGSLFKSLFVDSTAYDERSKQQALAFIATDIKADMGGTKLNAPLLEFLGRPLLPWAPTRVLIILTDGRVDDRNETIAIVSRFKHLARVSTIGIGHEVDVRLIEGISLAGRGVADILPDPDHESIQTVVVSQLAHALQPTLRDIKVEWKGAIGGFPAPPLPPQSLVQGQSLNLFLCEATVGALPLECRITGTAPDGGLWFSHVASHELSTGGQNLGKLGAWTRIQFEKDRKVCKEIAIRWNIGSSQTSWIASIKSGGQFPTACMVGATLPSGMYAEVGEMQSLSLNPLMPVCISPKEAFRTCSVAFHGMEKISRSRSRSRSPSPPPRKSANDIDDESMVEEARARLSSTISKKAKRKTRLLLSPGDEWIVPPSVSNWKNPRGVVIPLEKRLLEENAFFDPKSRSDDEKRCVLELAKLQSAEGWWDSVSPAQAWLGQSLVASIQSHERFGGDRLWATAIVLRCLERHFTAQFSIWKLLAQKARAWLKKECHSRGLNFDELMHSANAEI